MLLASKGVTGFCLLNTKGVSDGESLGDSKAFGIAGTGGTISSSLLPAALWTFLGFGVGNLDDDGGNGIRGCRDPVDVREVLKLVLELIESPELYDFRLISGVVRDDDGVDTFRGSIEGDRDDVLFIDLSGWGVGGVCGIGGGQLMVDSLIALRASVGLTVLAPSPLAWEDGEGMPGMIEDRLLVEVGVPKAAALLFDGDLAVSEVGLLGSGTLEETARCI